MPQYFPSQTNPHTPAPLTHTARQRHSRAPRRAELQSPKLWPAALPKSSSNADSGPKAAGPRSQLSDATPNPSDAPAFLSP